MREDDQKDLQPLAALLPRGAGHQFIAYADACSGVPGAPHEANLAAVNAIVRRLAPQPEFICFPGDEIQGLTADTAALRSQWRHWLDREMAWHDRRAIPLYHATGNHTTYDAPSEAVFREMLADLPRNGPPGQEGLAYWVRRGDLLLIVVNTLWSGGGGEGRVETAWLDEVLTAQADARHKLVMGHHPVFPANGFAGAYQRQLAPDDGRAFWELLVRHGVLAYLCSHMLAFDVQVHAGVLQILTAGAGTAHLMPPETEYFHCVQAALDAEGLRYQVLDVEGVIREWLAWPLAPFAASAWHPLASGAAPALLLPTPTSAAQESLLLAWQFRGVAARGGQGEAQTLLAGWDPGPGLASLWIGLLGPEGRLGILLSPAPGRSPHLWHGPILDAGEPFDLQIAIHAGMGPGGLLWRHGAETPWSSLLAASPWGAERLTWPSRWSIGHERGGDGDRPFRGTDLRAQWLARTERL